MTYLVDQGRLLSNFSVTEFDSLQEVVLSIAPSMCEYYLNDLIQFCDSSVYLNKNNIQQTINVDSYSIYLDYDSQIYIESTNSDDLETQSLW